MPFYHLSVLRRFLLGFVAVAALFGLAMLHPYPRQSLFGPTIRGKPWCVWEWEVRRWVHHDEREINLTAKVLRWMGIKSAGFRRRDLFDDVEMLPLMVELLDDPDPKIRVEMLLDFGHFSALHDESALPAFRRRLQDNDSENRIRAAIAIWKIAKERQAITVLLRELENEESDPYLRDVTIGFFVWSDAILLAPEIIPDLARRVRDADESVRCNLMRAMSKIGMKGIPTLTQGLTDSDPYVQKQAAIGLGRIGVNAQPVVPLLIEVVSRYGDRDYIEAAKALGRLGTDAKAAIPALAKLEKSATDADVRKAASDARIAIESVMSK